MSRRSISLRCLGKRYEASPLVMERFSQDRRRPRGTCLVRLSSAVGAGVADRARRAARATSARMILHRRRLAIRVATEPTEIAMCMLVAQGLEEVGDRGVIGVDLPCDQPANGHLVLGRFNRPNDHQAKV